MVLVHPKASGINSKGNKKRGQGTSCYGAFKRYPSDTYTESTHIITALEEFKDPNGEITPLYGSYQNRFHDMDKNGTIGKSNHSTYYYKKSNANTENVLQNGHIDEFYSDCKRNKPVNNFLSKNLSAMSSAIIALVFCIGALAIGVFNAMVKSNASSNLQKIFLPLSSENLFDEVGRYIYDDYDSQDPFSDFLPGLAGIYGKPLFAFFVNRGQGIASFGFESKNKPIMEFVSANKAYQTTSLVGFRTFIQGSRHRNEVGGEETFVIEPFSPLTTNYSDRNLNELDKGRQPSNKRVLYSGENEIQIQEIDFKHHLETNVTYFILPEEHFGAFVRRTTITNTHQDEQVTISFLDGLTRMQPAGGDIDNYLKMSGNTLEGFMGVYFPYKDSIAMPFYRLSSSLDDSEVVEIQERGHYCVSMRDDPNAAQLPIVYDTSKVFGQDTTLLRPIELYRKSIKEIVNGPQYGKAKTSSCFAAVEDEPLQPGESVTITTYFGATDHILDVPVIVRRLRQEGFAMYKLSRTREVVRQITSSVETQTGSRIFDAHVSQMFLDNSLRGGTPIVLGDGDEFDGMLTVDENPRLKVFHVFSRIHGDLERDDNDFLLPSDFFSQAPTNFRDVAENRRNDVVFNPKIGSFNVRMFLSFVQADGYEPSSVEAVVFTIPDKKVCESIAVKAVGRADGHRAQREELSRMLNNGPFRPGQLFRLMAEQNIYLVVSMQEFIDIVAAAADSNPFAVYKKGYCADYWTHYLDIIESYISIFPEEEENMLFNITLPYFFSPSSIQPRSRKYVESLSHDGRDHHIQQLDATLDDKSKRNKMNQFIAENTGSSEIAAHWQHDEAGEVFESTIYGKLFLLATLKFSTRDAFGMGIDYEGGRPGWDDVNNGIPGMLGSAMSETLELKALINYLLRSGKKYARDFNIPEELYQLFNSINENLIKLKGYKDSLTSMEDVPFELFSYWDNVATARETYREKTRITFSGETFKMNYLTAVDSLESWAIEIDKGITRAMKIGTNGRDDNGNSGIVPTYFAYEVSKWNRTSEFNSHGQPFVIPLNMTVRSFPLFLEGPTRMMKTASAMSARDIFLNVRNSTLYDKELRMYTVSASLVDQPIEMVPSMAFAQGWLENQSVWLQMSYKFYLELLRHKLYGDFFNSFQEGGLLPFVDPKVYGRAPVQCSSFIASSVFEDPSVRGRGFLGRLSGSTAEFLSIWILMFIGPEPFYVDDATGHVRMQLLPTLPSSLFHVHDGLTDLGGVMMEDDGTPRISFKLFSSINVHYYNRNNIDIWGVPPKRYRIGLRDGSVFDLNQTFIPTELAQKIRRVVFVDYIEAYF